MVCEFIVMEITYKTNRNISYSCNYHIVWCPKYRKKVLVGEVETRLKEITKIICAEVAVEPKFPELWAQYELHINN